ncbi:uncharacterized protein [Rutidosis leptorrhynchoides]|uniref:uncharacterized protein n=1 Tax=Rutidosis leptorrhynchoides TaxID=125765 RepID=UPI003A99D78F
MDSWSSQTSSRQQPSSLYAFLNRFPVIFTDTMLSLYFRYCGLSKSMVHLDDNETTMHIWAVNTHNLSRNKPNLVLIHGFGGNSKWQFIFQVRQLTQYFNVYIPDLVFFGESYTTKSDRSISFQAKCVCDVLKKMRVYKYSVYAISYGGFVAYKMAEEMQVVEKLVIVSSGIVFKDGDDDRKLDHVKKTGRNVVDLLVPKTPDDLRILCRMSIHNYNIIGNLFPDFILWGFIHVDCCKKEKEELVHQLLNDKPNVDLHVLTQETLLVWGEKDSVFPVEWAYQLHRHLGEKSKLEIIKEVGHAINFEAPYSLNQLIICFVLGSN